MNCDGNRVVTFLLLPYRPNPKLSKKKIKKKKMVRIKNLKILKQMLLR